MSRRTRLRGALSSALLALAVAALLPAAATATPQPEFSFNTGDGYRIHVAGHGSTVTLSVVRPSTLRGNSLATLFGASSGGHVPTSFGIAVSTYTARGEASATSIRAGFAGLGRVAVRFHPSGRVVHSGLRSGCGRGARLPRFATRPGVFRGKVDFEGEGGYTSAHIHSARGEVVVPLSSHCSNRTGRSLRRAVPPSRIVPSGPPGPKTTSLEAFWKFPLGLTVFDAGTDGTHPARYIAAIEQSEGTVAVYRLALALAPSQTFSSDSALSSASVAPPAPFSGEGVYRQGAAGGERSWSGSLAVSFPGAEDVPLTGPQFTTQLARSW